MDMIENYEEEFLSLAKTIQEKNTKIPTLSGDERRQNIRSAQKELEEAFDMLQQMETEARSLTQENRNEANKKIQKLQDKYNNLQKDLKNAIASFSYQEDRDSLFSGRPDLQVTSQDQRKTLLEANEKLDRTTGILEDTQRVAFETEELGTQVLGDLHNQRKVLENSRSNLKTADVSVDKSHRLLSIMGRRAIVNKIIFVIIILVLLAIIIVIIYFTQIKKKK
ncbi:vesicle transport v-snare 13 [Anaeramoeba ignava]|uniref:Vesicle transport v-snare 13 n=1 Tax=Anaeramoeba ignava TaxID=1746090 RepID=A0A9Q0R9R7_ANAIG|nr:vesicle transport v-snare 13 [Anaeramoeba ignava]|eukprot:Anaeramoba_ignava/a94885_28.p1 GENE.a94885_28~~a94885_28.p1  ORF type:complete len:223 (-),score=88.07 a94885_28:847-1515(-)